MADFTFAHRKEGFDNHIDASIRHYSSLHDDIVAMSRYFVENDTSVVDIGCSTGKTLGAMIDQNKESAPNAHYHGVENADGFAEDMKSREEQYADSNLSLHFQDVRNFIFPGDSSFITSIFTLQFIPKRDRQSILNSIYDSLLPGGAFVFSEKTYASSPELEQILTFLFYDHKRKEFSCEDIMDKEYTLRSMLKPMHWDDLLSMMNEAGFQEVQPFWRNHLFVGAIAIK